MKASTDAMRTNAILSAIRRRNLTILEIEEATGIHKSSVERRVGFLHAIRAVHISEYARKRSAATYSAVYAWGEGMDAQDPSKRKPDMDAPPELPAFVQYPIWHDHVFINPGLAPGKGFEA